MGITIRSKRCSQDMGYNGFSRFKSKVAEMVGEEFSNHYESIDDVPYCMNRKKLQEEYNKKTKQLIDDNIVSIEIVDFLSQTGDHGKIDRRQAKMIYELIKDCDDNLSYGYSGLKDCCTMKDLKALFNDKTKVEWD